MKLLSVKDLSIFVEDKPIVENIGFDLEPSEILALVGGSGSGKTTIGLSIINMLPSALTKRSGVICFEGQENFVRGRDIGVVFQEPLYAFNPVFTIGFQIDEVLKKHTDLNISRRESRSLELLDLVGIDEPKRVVQSYPHQLSGGMRQRAMIAQAIAAGPKVIIADEPTSNLDVTLQAMVMALFERLQKELGLSIILITHDLGVVKHFADKALVLSEGRIVEQGLVGEIFEQPKHSLTKALVGMTQDF